MTRKFPGLVLFWILCTGISQGQDNPRPKIGLALSGGGAKGFAHIGILQVMEEVGLVPDYIAGTSMGSLVGALYSIGYSTEELLDVTRDINWDVILANKISFERVAIEEKPYYGRYIAELPYENRSLNLPKGVLEGQELSMLFSRLTRSVHGITNFHEFPIPFECVASDITTGEVVVLDHGSLPDAMRASMAIPSFLTPVEIEDHYLVDGGLLRNFPVQNVIDMGADIVIGVYVSDDLFPKEELNSLIDVLSQSAFILSVFDTRKQKILVDIYIEPDMDGYGTASFASTDSIIARGLVAGMKVKEKLAALADSLDNIGPPPKIVRLPEPDQYLITDLKIQGNNILTDRVILKKMRLPSEDSISVNEIEERIRLAHGSGYLDKLTYRLIPAETGTTLYLDVKEAPPAKLKLAAHFDSENKAGINVNFTARNLLFNYSRAVVELDLAENPRVDANYLKYIGNKLNLAFSVGLNLSSSDYPFYDSNRKTAIFKNSLQHYYLQFQSTNSNRFTLGARLLFRHNRYKPVIIDDNLGGLNKVVNESVSTRFFYEFNTLNQVFFPTKGLRIQANYVHNLSGSNNLEVTDQNTGDISSSSTPSDPFSAAVLFIEYLIQISPKITVLTKNGIWMSNLTDGSLNFSDYIFVGGFNPRFTNTVEYLGASLYEFPTTNVFYSKFGIQYEMVPKVFLTGFANYADSKYPMKWISEGISTIPLGNKDNRFGYGASLAYNSPMGPLELMVAKDVYKDNYQLNLLIGFYF